MSAFLKVETSLRQEGASQAVQELAAQAEELKRRVLRARKASCGQQPKVHFTPPKKEALQSHHSDEKGCGDDDNDENRGGGGDPAVARLRQQVVVWAKDFRAKAQAKAEQESLEQKAQHKVHSVHFKQQRLC